MLPEIAKLIRTVYGRDVVGALRDEENERRAETEDILNFGFNPRGAAGDGLPDDEIPSDAFGDW